MNKCKYYNSHLDTVREYIGCLYNIDGCITGGMLHILLDDDNYDDRSIIFCLKYCLQNPHKEESKLGVLICEEYLGLSLQERRLLCIPYINEFSCLNNKGCDQCFIETGDFENIF